MQQISSVGDLAAAVRGRRLDLGLSQRELAERAGVSREWLNHFEASKPTAQLVQVLRVLETLRFRVMLDDADRLEAEEHRPSLDEILKGYMQE